MENKCASCGTGPTLVCSTLICFGARPPKGRAEVEKGKRRPAITRSTGFRRVRVVAQRPARGLSLVLAGLAITLLALMAVTDSPGLATPHSAHAGSFDGLVGPSQETGHSPDYSPSAQNACPPGFILDFSGLPAGTILGEQYASHGVHISAVANGDHPHAAIVFDTNASGSNDPDLEVDISNISVLARDLEDENSDGLVDFPDENNSGGVQIFSFDQPVHVESFVFIDKDHGVPDKAIAYDASNDVITTVQIPVGSNASVQTISVDADNVRRLEVVYRDSGGLTGIIVNCPAATPTPTPSPTPSPQILTATDPPTQTPAVLEVVLPPTLPSRLPATGGHPRR
jgi:hypothetical protein